jgi:hypothetical protein
MNRGWLAPLSGVVFVALVIIAFSIAGEPPDVDSPVEEITGFYADEKDSVTVGAALGTLAGFFLILFANQLRRALRVGPRGDSPMAPLVLVGASIMAVAIAIDATISLALAQAVDDLEPTSVQTLQALWDNDFLPIALGTFTLLVSAGVAILQSGGLPRWLGWVALALAAIGLTPIGWVAFLGGGIWILVVSITMALRSRQVAT